MQDKTVRCDGCSAEAWVSLKKPGSMQELDFCGHHYNKHSLMLHAEGFIIVNDERETVASAQ